MQLTDEQVRLIFGLKLRQLRTQKDLSLFGLAKKSGLSKSYLSEVEKGKKYPKPDKIVLLSQALDTPFDELVSMKLTGPIQPLSDIIRSGILKELPLEIFGIEESSLIDMIAGAPEKVTAFIGTLFDIARNYDVSRDQFYLAALKSHQESNENYFPDLEEAAKTCIHKHHLRLHQEDTHEQLTEVLKDEFGYKIDDLPSGDGAFPDGIRSVFVPKTKTLFISKTVSPTQRMFILAKELGYAHMEIKQRPLTFTWVKFSSFEEVLNNFYASYFAGALLLPEEQMIAHLKLFFKQPKWDDSLFLKGVTAFHASAETYFQRLSNILPKHFGLKQLYFLRFHHIQGRNYPNLTKELHLSKSHNPHMVRAKEHYCQRWISSKILTTPSQFFEQEGIRVGVQKSDYHNSEDEYLVLAASNKDPFRENGERSVCIGVQLTPKLKSKMKFVADPSITTQIVGNTCERCAVKDCKERVNDSTILNKQQRNEAIEQMIHQWVDKA